MDRIVGHVQRDSEITGVDVVPYSCIMLVVSELVNVIIIQPSRSSNFLVCELIVVRSSWRLQASIQIIRHILVFWLETVFFRGQFLLVRHVVRVSWVTEGR